jgi:hypothetical protein
LETVREGSDFVNGIFETREKYKNLTNIAAMLSRKTS